jgi:hypothetical protein
MMERYDHNNPWADKLQEIRLPGEDGSWRDMAAILDIEMPVKSSTDARRWILLIILLLLLIGVCNCPGRRVASDREMVGRGKLTDGRSNDGNVQHVKGGSRDRATAGKPSSTASADKGGSSAKVDNTEKKENTSKPGSDDMLTGSTKPGSGESGEKSTKPGSTKKVENTAKANSVKKPGSSVASGRTNKKGNSTAVIGSDKAGNPTTTGSTNKVAGSSTVGDIGKEANAVAIGGSGLAAASTPVSGPGSKIDSEKKLAQKVRQTDSTAIAPKKPTPDSILQVKGWMAGIGLNQFFAVGQQEPSKYNSSGTTGVISDYIPVPMVRYYFSRRLYVQLEMQFNSPQYTTKNLLASQSQPDSTGIPGQVITTSIYIKKLFYFNLPLSIHYSPFPNLYIGGGIQFARLTNGIALYEDSNHNTFAGGADSLKSSKIKSFKGDTVYRQLKTNEFRLLLDLNYNFKRFVVGARYNRALSDFIHLQLSTNQVTQSRNSSLQVYLRYILWDGRKKALLPK